MASGAGIIKNEFLKLADSLDQAFRGLILRIVGGGDEQLRLSLDSEVHSLLAHFAERGQMTLEEATIC